MEIERMFLLMLHVMSVVGAAVGIAFADLSLFKGPQVNQGLLRVGCQLVSGMLCLLWITGLLIIWLDTGFDLHVIAGKPKLMAKVGVAVLLSLNGYLLHRFFFNALMTPPLQPRWGVNAFTVLSTISGTSWLYAFFLGLAKPLAAFTSLAGFVLMFLALLALGSVVITLVVRPRLRLILQPWHPISTRVSARRAVDPPWVTRSRANLLSNTRESS